MVAMSQNCRALKFASDLLRADREIVWTALKQINFSVPSGWDHQPGDSLASVFRLKKETIDLMPVHFRLIIGRFMKSEHPVLSEVSSDIFESIGDMFTKKILMKTSD